MLIPPDALQAKGYRIWTVGDDICWMRIDTNGRPWAINPETGFFGVAPGRLAKTDVFDRADIADAADGVLHGAVLAQPHRQSH